MALALAVALALAACGGSGSPAASAGASAAGGGGSTSARGQARLKAAECMRAHGVDVPDPGSGTAVGGGGPAGGGEGGGAGARIGQIIQTPAGQAALKACASQIRAAFPFAALTPAQREQFRQDALKFAQCMRAHGVDIPDPTTGTGGGFGIRRAIPSSERNSPAFQSAYQACSSNLPRRGQFGGPGGGRFAGPGSNVGGPGA